MIRNTDELRDVDVAPFPIPSDPGATGPGVIVADPDPVLRRSIGQALGRFEFTVLAEAESPHEAWSLVRKLHPSVVVLGQTTTSRTVLEVARNVRSQSGAGVVLLAPLPNLEWVRQVRSAGVDALLGRPPREADLVAAIELTCARREEARRMRHELESLRERVETASLVQKAKELLMRREGVTDSEAYQRLRRQAERSGRSMKQIAEAVVLASRVASMSVR